MATTSKELPLGARAPPFSLPDVTSGKILSLDQIAGPQAALVMFLCRHCPYVKHVEPQLAQLAKDYGDRPIALVAISANDAIGYPEDAPASLRAQAEAAGFAFPYCHDESQAVARAYGAVCTPEFFLFDAGRALAYHGQLDGSRPGNRVASTGKDLRTAIEAVLGGRPVPGFQIPAVGCSIKWKHS
jgi:thiol-disulfide isomerase/thioredoxin